MKKALALSALLTFVCACASERTLPHKMQPDALKAAQQRGSAELDCPAATTEVLKTETIEEPQGTGWYEPPHKAIYTVAVGGCGKRRTYAVACDDRRNACVANTVQETLSSQPVQELVEKWQPGAVLMAHQRGSAELGCPAVSTEVLDKEAIAESQGTGWYEPPHRAEYTVAVAGCGKRATYAVTCDERQQGCIADKMQKSVPAPPPSELVEKLQPGAVLTAQRRGTTELGCPAASAQVLDKEAIEEPQGTGWYEPPHRAEYTVAVAGCGKRVTYAVSCDDRQQGCVARNMQ